jgi:hypothetical protein
MNPSAKEDDVELEGAVRTEGDGGFSRAAVSVRD